MTLIVFENETSCRSLADFNADRIADGDHRCLVETETGLDPPHCPACAAGPQRIVLEYPMSTETATVVALK